ncbi:MAG: glycosyltransferase [Pirellulales bacterium]|nr:glycosyltransferase [Pirellulales bacterium]
MAGAPEIAVIVSTFQRPGHLRRSLASLAAQRGVEGRFEAIVVDDGSRDETPQVVAEFAASAPFRVEFATHPHAGFQLAKCRNAGIRLARAPYLLFTDGDCIFPAEHLQRHLAAARPGVVRAGDCVRLEEAVSAAIGPEQIADGSFVRLSREAEDWSRIRSARWRAPFYQLIRHPVRPKLVGCNIAAWKSQLEAINGFDERFVGWGCEDDDLAARLRRSGARIASILHRTVAYHLWHAPHSTTPAVWSDGANVAYYQRPARLTRCLSGLAERDLADVPMAVTAGSPNLQLRAAALAGLLPAGDEPEVELLLGSSGAFCHPRASRLLIAGPDERIPGRLKRAADAVIRSDLDDFESILAELDRVLTGDAPAVEQRRAA